MRKDILLAIACVFVASAFACAQINEVDGFASVEADGLETTTGGAGGSEVTVTTPSQLLDYISRTGKYVIHVQGTINLTGMHQVKSDKTIAGVDAEGHIKGGGFNIKGASNIIIRNLRFTESNDDAINVQDNSHHIWIDHNDFSGSFDGLVDIRLGSSYVTVSWNRFSNQDKTCLIGSSEDHGAQDIGRLKVTYHHNWFDRTNQRNPRCRFGEVHVYNNFYDNLGSYGVASTTDAKVMVEGNYFLNVDRPTSVQEGSSPEGFLEVRDNYYDNSDATPETRGTTFEPSGYYEYIMEEAVIVKDTVTAWAGVGKIGIQEGDSSEVTDPDLITGIISAEASSIHIYPNPANSHASITVGGIPPEGSSVVILDTTGKVLFRKQLNKKKEEQFFPELSKGIYLVRIQSTGNVSHKKLIVQ